MPFHNNKIRKQMEKIYRQVSVKERLPEIEKYYHTNQGIVYFDADQNRFRVPFDPTYTITYWLEENTLETIQDKRELTATFLVNSIRLLDEQGARHLVKELCERFHLLPSEEQISKEYKLLKNEIIPHFKDGANYILNTLKGEKK